MARVKIVTDSTACISPQLAIEHDVRIVPLKVLLDSKSYAEGQDITTEEFYQKLPLSERPPTTSQPSVSEFRKTYEDLIDQGDGILSIHLSSKLSETVHSAQAAKRELPQAQIEVIDSSLHRVCAENLHPVDLSCKSSSDEFLDPELHSPTFGRSHSCNIVIKLCPLFVSVQTNGTKDFLSIEEIFKLSDGLNGIILCHALSSSGYNLALFVFHGGIFERALGNAYNRAKVYCQSNKTLG